MQIVHFLFAVHIQKFQTKRFKQDLVTQFHQLVIAGRTEIDVNHFSHLKPPVRIHIYC